jgi:hypothetical protein
LQEFFRTDTRPIAEKPLEMIGTQVNTCGNLVQSGLLPEVFPYEINRFRDSVVIQIFLNFHIPNILRQRCMPVGLIYNPNLAEFCWNNSGNAHQNIGYALGEDILAVSMGDLIKQNKVSYEIR